MVNQINLIGRLGNDPEVKQVGDNRLTTFSVATSRRWQKGGEWQEATEWHRCKKWGDYEWKAQKGDLVFVTGEVRNVEYESGDKKIQSYEVAVHTAKVVNRKEKALELSSAKNKQEVFDELESDLPF
jgi:single-strand DNA-binding protein